jgi:hypothetical protein
LLASNNFIILQVINNTPQEHSPTLGSDIVLPHAAAAHTTLQLIRIQIFIQGSEKYPILKIAAQPIRKVSHLNLFFSLALFF